MQHVYRIAIYSILFSVTTMLIESHPQAVNSGKEFWLTFNQNYVEAKNHSNSDSASDLLLSLTLVSDEQAHVQIDIESLQFHQHLDLAAQSAQSITIPKEAMMSSPGKHVSAAVHVTSSQPISIVALNRRFQTTDTYGAIAETMLGTEYRLACFAKLSEDLISQASVVATQEDTQLTIIPGADCLSDLKKAKEYTVLLNKGDVYHVVASYAGTDAADLSGSVIRANKKVAVFSGHSCAYVPLRMQACNLLEEQLHPVQDWGRTFYSLELPLRKKYSLKIIASEDQTEVEYGWSDGQQRVILSAGEFKDLTSVNGTMVVKASKPIQVVEYSHGQKEDNVGDPCMMLLRPVEKFAKDFCIVKPEALTGSTLYTTHKVDSWKEFALITVPTNAVNSLRVNGQTVSSQAFKRVDAVMSVVSIPIETLPSGVHVQCDQPISLVQYGIGIQTQQYDSYGHGW